MNREVKWKGIYPAVLTMFHEDGSLDMDTYLINIRAQVAAGVQGIIIGGSLGESSTLTHDDRLELLSATLGAVGDHVDVIVNIAEGSTRAAIELAQKAEANGAHGLMVLPPMMYKPTDAEVVQFFKDVASSTKLSILLYNNPVDYKIEITMDMLEQLTTVANIQAVKEDIYRWFLPILELDINPQLVQNIKLAAVKTGIGTEYVRAPRSPLVGAERERVLQILDRGLATRPQLPDYLQLSAI